MSETLGMVQPSGRHGSWRSRALFLAKLIIAAGFLTWLFASGKLDLSPLGDIRHWGFLLAAAASLGLSMILPIWRWLALLKVQELDLAWPKALGMTWLGYFASLFLPGATGGDLAKAYLACRNKPIAKTAAVSTVLMDRVVGLQSLLLIASVAGILLLTTGCSARLAAVSWSALLLFGASVLALFFVLWPPTSGIALKLLPRRFRKAMTESLALYRVAWGKLPCVILYSCFCNALGITSYVLVALALGERFSYGHVLAVPLVAVANSLPISPGGLGVGEAVGAQLFAEFGSANGALIILIVRLGVITFSLPGSLALFGTYRYQGAPQASLSEE